MSVSQRDWYEIINVDEKFRSMEEKYFSLRGRFEAGTITRAEFEFAAERLPELVC